MSTSSFEQEMATNQEAFEKLRERIRRDFAGQYVALSGGRLVASGPTYDGVVDAVRRLSPVPEHFLVFPADEEPDFEPFFDF